MWEIFSTLYLKNTSQIYRPANNFKLAQKTENTDVDGKRLNEFAEISLLVKSLKLSTFLLLS